MPAGKEWSHEDGMHQKAALLLTLQGIAADISPHPLRSRKVPVD